ncbi:PspC domain-containing protein [Sinosporangium siamense]|uniref:Phage shock protein PspC N-terminal domain-containing protein n=1 Tax=Sinosporangium siamense TaxID=1367973 RepID=A0A919RFD2_9ACTN|nr:PspC domain-containing protein [Sinosporangium siamense]GII90866.1 hypothetical protein Ssi02_10970 [Sinosporangium siamense]
MTDSGPDPSLTAQGSAGADSPEAATTNTASTNTATTTAARPQPLLRSNQGRVFTGVCAGLGRHAGIDPVLFRVTFALLSVASGTGLMLYAAAFLLMRNAQGRPGLIEQWTRRAFDTEIVLALLTAVFAFGIIISLASGGIGISTLILGTVLAITLLAARSRGVELPALVRSLPEWIGTWRSRGAKLPTDPMDSAVPYGTAAAWADAPTPAGPRPVPSRQDTGAYTAVSILVDREPAAPEPARTEQTERTERTRTERAHSAPAAHADEPPVTPPQGFAVPPPGHAPPPDDRPHYERTADGVGYGAASEPFAPRGPYQQHAHHEQYGGPAGYDYSTPYPRQYDAPLFPAAPATPPAKKKKRKRPKSYVSALTLCLAMIVGGVVVANESVPGPVLPSVAGGAMLVTIGLGLLVATWFGRGAALVAAGTIMSVVLVIGATVGGVQKKVGSARWMPTTVAEAEKTYALGIGEGTLDLSDLRLEPGSRTTFNASISFGEMTVILPPTARAEVTGYVRFGDVQIDHAVVGGTDVRHHKILEPEVRPKGAVPTIVLEVRAGVGDVEVRRAA